MIRSIATLLRGPTLRSAEPLAELMRKGKVTPVIDRCYPLSEIPEAIRYLEEGHARGKVVINRIDDN